MHQITATQFKARCLASLDQVAADGEKLQITKHGRPVAELRPVQPMRAASPLGAVGLDRAAAVIVLDTHVLVWCSLEPGRLGPVARARLVEAWQQAEVAASRDTWLHQGLGEIPLDGGQAIAAVERDGLHADPADAQLLGWQGERERLDASAGSPPRCSWPVPPW